jgi:hypothetical protein
MVSPSPRQPWQVPLRSVITFCRLYPNECDVAVAPTSGGSKQGLGRTPHLPTMYSLTARGPHEAVELIQIKEPGALVC